MLVVVVVVLVVVVLVVVVLVVVVSGVAAGVAVTGSDAGPSPTLLVAVTVNVYSVPLVSPSTVHDVADGVQVPSDGETVTV